MAKTQKREKLNKNTIYRIILWGVGIVSLFVFSLVINQPWILFLVTFIALLSREWLLTFIITGIRGTGIFGLMGSIDILWLTLCIFFIFIWALFRFFFDTDRFLKKVIRSRHINNSKNA